MRHEYTLGKSSRHSLIRWRDWFSSADETREERSHHCVVRDAEHIRRVLFVSSDDSVRTSLSADVAGIRGRVFATGEARSSRPIDYAVRRSARGGHGASRDSLCDRSTGLLTLDRVAFSDGTSKPASIALRPDARAGRQ